MVPCSQCLKSNLAGLIFSRFKKKMYYLNKLCKRVIAFLIMHTMMLMQWTYLTSCLQNSKILMLKGPFTHTCAVSGPYLLCFSVSGKKKNVILNSGDMFTCLAHFHCVSSVSGLRKKYLHHRYSSVFHRSQTSEWWTCYIGAGSPCIVGFVTTKNQESCQLLPIIQCLKTLPSCKSLIQYTTDVTDVWQISLTLKQHWCVWMGL